MNIGIDIDGVIFPWAETANDVVRVEFGLEDPGPHTTWLHLKNTLTSGQWSWLWSREGQDAVFGQASRVYPGVVPVLKAILRDPDHRCHFVTHRDPRRAGAHTAAFLYMHFRAHPWAGMHVIQNGTPKHGLLDWDVFVDDKPETVLNLLTFTNARVFAPVRPWNTELAAIDSPRFLHYGDPRQLAEALLEGW